MNVLRHGWTASTATPAAGTAACRCRSTPRSGWPSAGDDGPHLSQRRATGPCSRHRCTSPAWSATASSRSSMACSTCGTSSAPVGSAMTASRRAGPHLQDRARHLARRHRVAQGRGPADHRRRARPDESQALPTVIEIDGALPHVLLLPAVASTSGRNRERGYRIGHAWSETTLRTGRETTRTRGSTSRPGRLGLRHAVLPACVRVRRQGLPALQRQRVRSPRIRAWPNWNDEPAGRLWS